MSCWPAWGVLEVQHWWPRETYWRCTPKHKKKRRLLWHGDSCRPWSACNFNGWMGDGFCWQIYASPCEQVVGIRGCVLNWPNSKYNGGSSGCSDILKWICTLLHQICRYHVHSCQRANQMTSESHLSKSDTDIDSPGGHNIPSSWAAKKYRDPFAAMLGGAGAGQPPKKATKKRSAFDKEQVGQYAWGLLYCPTKACSFRSWQGFLQEHITVSLDCFSKGSIINQRKRRCVLNPGSCIITGKWLLPVPWLHSVHILPFQMHKNWILSPFTIICYCLL